VSGAVSPGEAGGVPREVRGHTLVEDPTGPRTARMGGCRARRRRRITCAWYEADAAVHSNYTFTGCGRINRRLRRLGYVYQGET
jgi:hypothetical protein